MSDLPLPIRTRTTAGSKRLAEFGVRNNVRPLSWYVPLPLHTALVALAERQNVTLQLMLTHACEVRYADPADPKLPPLVPPTKLKLDPHKNVTWYCPVPLYMAIKQLSLNIGASTQQLITSAVVDQFHATPEVKALRIMTGVAPYLRAPVAGEASFQRPPRPQKQ